MNVARWSAEAAAWPEGPDWPRAFAAGFEELRATRRLHPSACAASTVYRGAAQIARDVSSESLPLGLGLTMHLYPLAALRCVPLPWWSPAARRRSNLLHEIDENRLILANAGSERAAGAHAPVTATRVEDGVRIDGAFEYVSLAHVADLVLFSAPLGAGHVFCAADMKAASIEVGASRFNGSMRLSDTCSIRFRDHVVPTERLIEIPTSQTLGCMAAYQRSWFHLLLADAYLARIDRLHQQWSLPKSPEHVAGSSEIAFLREYALRLLDEARPPNMDALSRITATIKLRASWLAQSTAERVRPHDSTAATELGYIRLQPTSDARILQSLAEAAA